MELLWALASTIALSLLLPLIFIKLLSATPNFEANEKEAVIKRDHDAGVKSDSPSWEETEEFVPITKKIDEFRENSVLGKLIISEIVDVISSGSLKIHNSGRIDDRNRIFDKIEGVNLAEDESNQGVELKGKESSARKIEEDEILPCERVHEEIDESSSNKEVAENSGMLAEDDWEGIERTELEKRFGAAVAFVGSNRNSDRVKNLSNDVKMKLYGYHRIVTQGPCHEPQPMALKFSARAKWNAWRQLGIMNPEVAMERYISLLSENIPDWIAEADYPNDNAKLASAEIPASAKLTL